MPDASGETDAAREALRQAGVQLQEAGEALQQASGDGELAEAEAALSRARLAVLVAGHDLLKAREAIGQSDGQRDGGDQEDVFRGAENSLNDANVAIVIATQSIFSPKIDLPRMGADIPQSNIPQSSADKKLNASIKVFQSQILEARREAVGSAPPPTGPENVPGVGILGGGSQPVAGEGAAREGTGGESTGGEGTGGEGANDGGPGIEVVQSGEGAGSQPGRAAAAAEVAAAGSGPGRAVPEDVPDPQGDDIVAQQLREAAMAETDPTLREKLWDEYKKYKAGL